MSQEPSRPDRILGGFASLLSSALTASGETPESLADSASTLPRFISTKVSDDETCCTVPCLMLKHSDSSSVSRNASSLEETAALYLARPLALTRIELEAAPVALLGNLSESFMSLVDSRLRSSLVALLRQSPNQHEATLSNVLAGLLSTSANPISPTAVVTSFRVLPVSDRAQNGDHVAPLVMETVIDLEILQQLVSVTVVAPGTIQGAFSTTSSDGMLTNVEVVLDTVAFLQSMMKQARFAVRKAVAIASGIASKIIIATAEADSSVGANRDENQADSGTNNNNQENGDGSFSSSMMPPPRRLPQAQSSTPDLPKQPQESPSDSRSNASWDDGMREDGLSLLTAAAVGLKRTARTLDQGQPKKQRADTSTNTSIPRSVASHPGLGVSNGNGGHVDATA